MAALAILLVVGRELWRSHKEADQRERDRADAAESRLAAMVDVLNKAKPK